MITPEDFSRIYWISGSVCAGKTTTSSIIAKRNDWNVYHADDWLDDHRERADPKKQPTFHAVSHITGDALWLRPLQEQIQTDVEGANQEFDLILEDVEYLLRDDPRPLVVDCYVYPLRILSLLPSKQHVFYLIATESFLLDQYRQRPWIHNVLAKTSDKEKAWDNWMKRDISAAQSLKKEAEDSGAPWLSVDGTRSIDETVGVILKHFQP